MATVKVNAKIWNWAEVQAGGEWVADDGNNELEVPMGSKNCWKENTRVSEQEGQDVVVREGY